MGYKFTNYATALLDQQLGSGDSVAVLEASAGNEFPALGAGEFFPVAIQDTTGNYEYCLCTARSGDSLTLTRGQEGTSPLTWAAGSRLELRCTAAVLEEFLQRSGDTVSGDLDFQANQIINALINAGRTIGTLIRATDDSATNQIEVPAGGLRPTIGGVDIALLTDIANFLDETSNATITGDWDFTNVLQFNGVDVATVNDIPTKEATNSLPVVNYASASSELIETADLFKKHRFAPANGTDSGSFAFDTGLGAVGDMVFFSNKSTGALTISGGGASLRKSDGTTGDVVVTGQYKVVGFHKVASGEWEATGVYDT
jgi:hypothetical protein